MDNFEYSKISILAVFPYAEPTVVHVVIPIILKSVRQIKRLETSVGRFFSILSQHCHFPGGIEIARVDGVKIDSA